jgi:cysteine desulfurase
MNRIYLDYAANHPILPEVKEQLAALVQSYSAGNPSSIHTEGRTKQAFLDKAHTTVAAVFGVQPTEVVFTSGATEANTILIRGVLAEWREKHPNQTPHIIMSGLEHPSWRSVAKSEAAEITVIPPSKDGVVDPQAFVEAIKDTTALIGCIYVSNEIGTVQPVEAIGKGVEAWRLAHKSIWPVFHTDAVQAIPYQNTHFGHTHADAMTISGHKFGALEGVGALIIKKHVPIMSVIKGGGQEWGYRAGTENVLGIVSLATALEASDTNRDELTRHASQLQSELESELRKTFPEVTLLGGNVARSPHITYLWWPGMIDETLVQKLDLAGVASSSGSACSSGAMLPSSTLLAMGYSDEEAFGGLRLSYGRFTVSQELQAILSILKSSV